jgi:Mn-dependent DtxR family transcriptional regulator
MKGLKDQADFYTLKGYERNQKDALSTAMEDYLEMICRMLQSREVVRIKELSHNLHVNPSSASKMVQNLKLSGLVKFEKYGYIELTDKGRQLGAYLLHRHEVLHRFLCKLNGSESELEQVEKIEHYISETTIRNLEALTARLDQLR